MGKNADEIIMASQHAAEAASAPAVKMAAVGAGLTGIADFLQTGTGLATAIGLALTLCSFLLQLWSVMRRDAREQREHELRLRREMEARDVA